MNTNAREILETISNYPNGISCKELSKNVSVTLPSLYSNIGKLLKAQKILKEEINKEKIYKPVPSVYFMKNREENPVSIGFWVIVEKESTMFVDGINKNKGLAYLTKKRNWTWKKRKTAEKNLEFLRKIYPTAELVEVFSDGSITKI
ncbi:MAG: hypothetical protein ACOC1P_04780 [Minisyncoccales bacterium]